MEPTVIVSAARTATGKFGGALSSLSATELGAVAIKAALERAPLAPSDVGYVIMGHVLQAGAGQITARQAAVGAGVPMHVGALTINKVCLSGLNAIALADQLIRAGETDRVVAGGMESMSNAPYLVPKARFGLRYGDASLIDSLVYDGLFCAFEKRSMGEATEEFNARYALSRLDQDEWAARSHQRAAKATEAGLFSNEIAAIETKQGIVVADEGIRPDSSVASLANLRPAFAPDGTITAGNASQISDGASALVVMSAAEARGRGLEPLAQIVAHGMVAGPDTSLHLQPAHAIEAALAKVSLTARDLRAVEINEAFASVAVVSTRELGLDEAIVNPNGGAIALGHPIGASGARLVVSLIAELRRCGGGVGAAALCGGGGQGDALIIRV